MAIYYDPERQQYVSDDYAQDPPFDPVTGQALGFAPNVSGYSNGQYTLVKPWDAGFDPTYGGYSSGNPNLTSNGTASPWDIWLNSVYKHQGWDLPPLPGPAPNNNPDPTPTTIPPGPTTTTATGGGTTSSGGGGGGTRTSGTLGDMAFNWPTTSLPTYTPPPAFDYPGFSYESYAPAQPFSYADFQKPTLEEAQQDPGYEFARTEGLRAIKNRASAMGSANTGGTLKDLMTWGNNFANQNYGNVFDRNLRTYSTNRDNAFNTWGANELARAQAYDRNYKTALDSYTTSRNNAAENYATNYGVSRDTFDRNYRSAYDTGQMNQRQAELTFQDLYKIGRAHV